MEDLSRRVPSGDGMEHVHKDHVELGDDGDLAGFLSRHLYLNKSFTASLRCRGSRAIYVRFLSFPPDSHLGASASLDCTVRR